MRQPDAVPGIRPVGLAAPLQNLSLSYEGHHISGTHRAIHRTGDLPRDGSRRRFDRIAGEVRVALSCRRLSVAEHLAYDRQAKAAGHGHGSECVAQVVQSHVI